MVKHIILWQLKDELSAEEKVAVKAGIKEGLEALAGKIPGLTEIKVQTEGLASSISHDYGQCDIATSYSRCRKERGERNSGSIFCCVWFGGQ